MRKYLFAILNSIIAIFVLNIFKLNPFMVGWISACVYWTTINYYMQKEKDKDKNNDLLD